MKKLFSKINKFLKFVFSRKAVIVLMILIQLIVLVSSFFWLAEVYRVVYWIFTVLGLVLVLYLLNTDENPAYKIAWIIPLLLVPVLTAMLFLFFKAQIASQLFSKKHQKKIDDTKPLIKAPESLMEEIHENEPDLYKISNYMYDFGHYSVYNNTKVTYFSIGEEKFEALKNELKKAEKFIFLEYFIIGEGKMWGEILEILKEKAAQGVDVRLLYDGFGSQMILPDHYDRTIRKYGIKCKIFNKFRPFLSTTQNNRDHRKIVVIDGVTAFNGGINLADEYINEKERFGHWKDTAVMLKGEAVWSFTIMFLQMWELDEKTDTDYKALSPIANKKPDITFESDGYVMPYGDSPIDKENVGELVYLDIINNARDYVYITTPYLIMDNELITALGYAAKSGVDVRIITPGIPDKWYVYVIGQSYYSDLLKMGVKIYEYAPGFMHAKNFVSDDTTAVVGTINLDYRSLYLHFECATYLYKTACIKNIKEDFLQTLTKCKKIDMNYCKKRPFVNKVMGGFLKLFAPLL